MQLGLDFSLVEELVAGVDEVGRGPLCGPVVTAAVILDPARPILGLNDSKKLSEARRERLFDEIREKALGRVLPLDQRSTRASCDVGSVSPRTPNYRLQALRSFSYQVLVVFFGKGNKPLRDIPLFSKRTHSGGIEIPHDLFCEEFTSV